MSNNYPKLIYNLGKLEANINQLAKIVKTRDDFTLTIVTKSILADEKICEVIAKNPNVDYIADTRIDNIKVISQYAKENGKEVVMLRLPMLTEAEDVVRYADISLNSELVTIQRLNHEAEKLNKIHKVVMMIDLGDLREGIFYEDVEKIMNLAKKIKEMDNVQLFGIGTNLTCFGGVIPKAENLQILCDIAKEIEMETGIKVEMISGGNSSSVYLSQKGEMPDGINNLRLGESFLLCNDTAYKNIIEGCYKDAIICEAEIIELQYKPSYPIGEIGFNAMGRKPKLEDRGEIHRAILAIGEQDTDPVMMTPAVRKGKNYVEDPSKEILGSSSDHMIMDVSKSNKDVFVGDIIAFKLEYSALLRLATSPYVHKEYI